MPLAGWCGTTGRPAGGKAHGDGNDQDQADRGVRQATAAAATARLLKERLDQHAAGVFPAGSIDQQAALPLPGLHHGTTITRTMLDVNLDRSGPLPLHDQVAAQIRRAIADGEAGPGDRLPLAKDIAAVLGVNKNTVLRALHILREEGLLEFRRGRGVTVVGTPEHGAVLARVRELLDFAQRHGYQPAEVIQMIKDQPGR
jgi:GntR family transcriptional regulator